MSPVLSARVVRAPGADLPTEVILKLYDRRCLNNIREDQNPPATWSPEKDSEYAQWLQDLADGKVLPTNFDDEEFWDKEDMSGGRLEDYLQWRFDPPAVWNWYGTVAYRDPSTHTVPGILIEYIPGPTMRERLITTWTTRTPRPPDAELAAACEVAVTLIERVAYYDFINVDVRIDNFIFRDDADTGERSPVVLIDLTHCKQRGSLTDEEWCTRKVNFDEIGAAGQVLMQKVREHVGPGVWHYNVGKRRWTPKP